MGNPSPGYDPAYQQPPQGQYPQPAQPGQPPYPQQPAEGQPYGQPAPAPQPGVYGQPQQQPYAPQPVSGQPAQQPVPPQPGPPQYGQPVPPPAPYAVPKAGPARPGAVSMAMIMAFVTAGIGFVSVALTSYQTFFESTYPPFRESTGRIFVILGILVSVAAVVVLVLGAVGVAGGRDSGRVMTALGAGYYVFAGLRTVVFEAGWLIEFEFNVDVITLLLTLFALLAVVGGALAAFPLAGRPASRWFAEKTLAR